MVKHAWSLRIYQNAGDMKKYYFIFYSSGKNEIVPLFANYEENNPE